MTAIMTAQQFLNLLEEEDLIPSKVLKQLRRQVAGSKERVPARSMADWLIEEGYLDRGQAEELLARRSRGLRPEHSLPPPSHPAPPQGSAAPTVSPSEGDLDLAPLTEPEETDLPLLTPVEDELPLLEPLDGVSPPAAPTGLVPLEDIGLAPLEDGLVPLEDEPPGRGAGLVPLDDSPGLTPLDDVLPLSPAPATPPPRSAGNRPAAAPPERTASAGQKPAPGRPVEAKRPATADKEKTTRPRTPPSTPIPTPLGGEELVPLLDDDVLAPALPTPAPRPAATTRPPQPAAGPAPGPPIDLLADAAPGGLLAEGPLDAASPTPKGWLPGRRRSRRGNRWDSSLLLISGGALLVLAIVAIGLAWALTRESGDEQLRAADDLYKAGSYTQAIANYDAFLEAFPKHPGASQARVNRGLCQMRQAVASASTNWTLPLETAQQVVEEIAAEPEFKMARGELASILPAIAEGLARRAQAKTDPKLIAQAREALALIDRHVPKSLRPHVRIADVEASLALTEREVARGGELEKALTGIARAVASKDLARAYALRGALVRLYPDLEANEKLRAAVLTISEAERVAVRFASETRPAVAEPLPPSPPTTALARQWTVGTAAGAEGRVIFAQAEGVVYALDAGSGRLLWRRFLGIADNGWSVPAPPLPLGDEPGADVLLADRTRQEIQRVEAVTGRTRWRHALGTTFDAHPVLINGEIVVATSAGRLVRIDAESGASSGHVQFSQRLSTAPALDERSQLLFQLADHSSLFVLSLDDEKSRQVVYLGHEPGTMPVPPVVMSRYLFLVENRGFQSAIVRVYAIASGEGPTLTPMQEIQVGGAIDTPPLVIGPRVVLATDRGEIQVYELRNSGEKAQFERIAETIAATGEDLVRFTLADAGQLWVADSQLTKYDIQTARGRLVPKWIKDEHSTYLQPLALVGQNLIQVRTRDGVPGLLAAAIDMATGDRVWETHLASPLAGTPQVSSDGSTVSVVSAAGAVFRLAAADLAGQSVAAEPVAALSAAESARPVTAAIALDDQSWVLGSGEGAERIALLDAEAGRFRAIPLPGVAACDPVRWGPGLLVPLRVGQILLLDPKTGEKLAEPFQPALPGGANVAWHRPAAFGGDRFAVFDGAHDLYTVGIKKTPVTQLAQIARKSLTDALVTPLAVAGDRVCAGDATGALASYELAGLADAKKQTLGGQCVWGPRAAGTRILVATSDDQLVCLGDDLGLLWRIPLPQGLPVGEPLLEQGSYLVAFADGRVCRLESASGKLLGQSEAGQPLAIGPSRLGEELLVSTVDGSLVKLAMPSPAASAPSDNPPPVSDEEQE